MNWDTSKFDQTLLSLRGELSPHTEFVYRVEKTIPLQPSSGGNVSGIESMRSRRTRRDFGPIDTEEIGNFLYLATSPTGNIDGPYGPVNLRPSPSAGARHPIDVLILNPAAESCMIYRSIGHAFDVLICDPSEIHALADQTRILVPWNDGVLVWLVAQPGRTMAKYDNAESFVYFDAGALVTTLSFVAHALNLSYCPLGISGEPTISRLLRSQGHAIGLLGGVLGTRLDR